MTKLERLQKKKKKLAIGMISGTSADGIDAVLVTINGTGESTRIRQHSFASYPYPKKFKEWLLASSQPGKGTVDQICELNILSALFFADAAKRLARKSGVALSEIELIGSHGQSIHHIPDERQRFGKKVRSTLQIGDPSTIAKLTGVVTVGDFRTADMAVGGQGAPLVPFLDYVLFRSKKKSRLLLNLGGIANMTALPKNCSIEKVSAFDTGPANMIIDGLMKKFYGRPFDRGGEVAQTGRVIPALMNWMSRLKYFELEPPKSTGRELFSAEYLRRLLQHSGRNRKNDVIATVTEFTAYSVHGQYQRFVHKRKPVDEVIASGGGVHNKTMMLALRRYFSPIPVVPIEHLGVSSDAKEAILFAVLANQTITEQPSNVPGATGAQKPVVLGKICL
ncbi:MAG: anhydro-N-acetylmuramic acid kinase [Ignavibacteriales bacterium]|nr:anhydro-N-acetylmuramic acid kinase [Ignavibacteriales bacterium]